jgi:hypothetical protein
MAKLIAQLSHGACGELDEIDVWRVMRQQATPGAKGVSRGNRVLHQVAALDQGEQVTVDRPFGQLKALGKLGDTEFLT